MKKLTISLLCTFICLNTLWIGEKDSSKDDDSPRITIENDTLTFSSTCINDSMEQEITILNSGNEDLVISSMSIDGTNKDDFTVSETCNTITGGNQCNITIKFLPSSTGNRTANLVIQSNANDNRETIILLIGYGQDCDPIISVDKNHLSFESICVGNSLGENITIENSGINDLVINSITIEGDDADDFSFTGSYDNLKNGETCSINVTFLPTKIGNMTASLVINSNDTDNPELSIPLDGTGLPHPGTWEGNNVKFYVSEDGEKITTEGSPFNYEASLVISGQGYACGSYLTITKYYLSEMTIHNLEFNYSTTNDNINGTFSENNICTVSGWIKGTHYTYYPWYQSCSYTINILSLQATPNSLKSGGFDVTEKEGIIEYYNDGRVKSITVIQTE